MISSAQCNQVRTDSPLRTILLVPGGFGVFEAASAVILKFVGVGVPIALAATILLRGLTFWLPMVRGLFFSRAIGKPKVGA